MKKVLLLWLVICTLMPFRTAYAYLVEGDGSDVSECIPANRIIKTSPTLYGTYTFNSATFANLSDNQYMSSGGSTNFAYDSSQFSFLENCSNLGQAQSEIAARMEVYSGSDYITVNLNSIVGVPGYAGLFGSSYSDENQSAILIKTNIPGLFYFPMDNRLGGYPPELHHGTGDYKDFIASLIVMPVISKAFQGMPKNTVVSSSPVQFIITDENEPDHGTQPKGNIILSLSIPVKGMDVKLAASCQYTLSDNGSIDFGDQRVTQITDDRNTTVKRSMTLNMDNCYGVNKVKTTITTTAPTAESGLLLGNGVADGAKNVAVALRVNPNYTESGTAGDNTGKDMYFDSSNPLEWNFGNAYTVNPMSKHIPLDVWLLRNGGEPTPGDYHASATIMMDFI